MPDPARHTGAWLAEAVEEVKGQAAIGARVVELMVPADEFLLFVARLAAAENVVEAARKPDHPRFHSMLEAALAAYDAQKQGSTTTEGDTHA